MRKAQMDRSSPWTCLELVRWTTDYFSNHRIESPRIEAEILLAHALEIRRIDLYLNHDKPLGADELARFKSLIKRRLNKEPVAYITGNREFWSLPFSVNPSVLIPRPETECLVEALSPFLSEGDGPPRRLLEMGTGSGAIVISLCHDHPRHLYIAMDQSAAALATARENARRNGLSDRIQWFCGNWETALAAHARFDFIVSNPPYVRSGDIEGLAPEIRLFEPKMALDGSADGLFAIRRIIETAHLYLKSGGVLALEMGFDQREAVSKIVSAAGQYDPPRFIKDYAGLDRLLLAKTRSSQNSI